MIKSKLDKIKDRISDPSFLANKGLSNEVGIHVFCYDPKDEIVVQDYVSRLKNEVNTPYRIIECDLYEIFLSLLEDKRVLRSVDSLEEKRGKDYLLNQLQKIATPEALLARMDYSPHVMLGGRKTVICEFLGTGMISVMPVPLLSVHPREYSQQGHIRYVPSVCVYRWTCPVPPHKPPLQAL